MAALRALVSRLQARTSERLQAHAERADAQRVAGEPVASLSRRIADVVAALSQALLAMADRRAAQARQAEQEMAARQQEIAAGASRFRDRYADRRRQEAEARATTWRAGRWPPGRI